MFKKTASHLIVVSVISLGFLSVAQAQTTRYEEPTIINPDSMHPGLRVVVLASAESADPTALMRSGVFLSRGSVLEGKGSIEFVDPTPVAPRVRTDDVASRYLMTTRLDPRRMGGLLDIPVRFLEGGVLSIEECTVMIPGYGIVGANPTPYPYPVPILDEGESVFAGSREGWVSGMEPSPFIVDGGGGATVVYGYAALMDGDELLGLIGTATIEWSDGSKSTTDTPVLLVTGMY